MEINGVKEKPKNGKYSAFIKWIKIVTVIITLLGAVVGYVVQLWEMREKMNEKSREIKQEINNRGRETDFILQQIITSYDKRLTRLEKYLDIAMEKGAIAKMMDNSYNPYINTVASVIPPKLKDSLKLEIKKTYNKSKNKSKTKSVKDYKKDFRMIQQTTNNKPIKDLVTK